MTRFRGLVLMSVNLVLLSTLALEVLGQTDEQGLVNNTSKKWVARRNPGDLNPNNDIAAIVRITETTGVVKASLYVYKTLDEDGLYADKSQYLNIPIDGGIVNKPGVDGRKRQTAKFVKLFPITGSTSQREVTVLVSLYQNEVPPESTAERRDQRVILRYKIVDISAMGARTVRTAEPCDDVPNEDVLEEEDVSTDELSYSSPEVIAP